MRKFGRVRVGLAVGCDRVNAVRMTHGQVTRAKEVVLGIGNTLGDALRECLEAMHAGSRWQRTSVDVALEPSRVQVRRIPSLPILSRPDQRHALAELSRHEHFLGRREQLAVFVGEQEADGSLWVLCTDTDLIGELSSAIAEAHMFIARIIPAIDLLAASGDIAIADLRRTDGSAVVGHACVADGQLTKTWRSLRDSDEAVSSTISPRSLLASMGGIVSQNDASRYDAAVAALASLPRSRFAEPTMRSIAAVEQSGFRFLAQFSLAVSLSIVALVGPAVQAHVRAEQTAATIETEQVAFRSAAAQQRVLDSIRTLHEAIARFRSSSVPALGVMSSLGDALTADSYVTSLSVDSLSTQATVLAPSATEILERLGSAAGIDSVSLTGAITRERIVSGQQSQSGIGIGPATGVELSRELERVVIRFVTARAGATDALIDQRDSRRRGASAGLIARSLPGNGVTP